MNAPVRFWRVQPAEPGLHAPPGDAWIEIELPGTVAAVANQAGVALDRLDDLDWWFAAEITTDVDSVLRFDAVATIAEVRLDGVEVARSSSMFTPIEVPVPAGDHQVGVVVRSLTEHLRSRRPRGRWRSSMTAAQGLRWVRTSMLGRAPVFSGAPSPVGPWRPVTLVDAADAVQVSGRWNGGAVLQVRGTTPASSVTVSVAGARFTVPARDGVLDAALPVPGAQAWWPHTHGEPVLYPVTVDGHDHPPVGFRSVELDRESMALRVNGIDVFCRGGCWVPLNPITLQNEPAELRAVITAVRSAGLNMLRVTGTMVYEDEAFFDECARQGVLVWQDLMLATLDPPDDLDIADEVRNLLRTAGLRPSFAVLSGGSETHQQPTMLGLDAAGRAIELLETTVPGLVGDSVPYVVSSPTGGDLPTHVGTGVAHYFGVGGYLRPFSDIRSAGVRFAAESLAFAVPPERRVVDAEFGSANVAGHLPEWKAAVPRDRGSSWDFEDVRDHYVRTVFGVEPSLVRRDDAERYLDYGRAAICEAVVECYSYWRSARSGCGGALVLTLRDLEPGAGWGFTDSAGGRKAPWFALARLSASVAILLTDEGMDGYRIEVVNDRPHRLLASLDVTVVGRTGAIVAESTRNVELPGHGWLAATVDGEIGHFTDASHAHRFGPRVADAVVVTVRVADQVVAQEVRLVGGPTLPLQNSVGLAAVARCIDSRWELEVTADFAAQYVCVDVDGWEVSDSWFHLAPGGRRLVTLTGGSRKPTGHVRALNSLARARIVEN